MTDPTTNADLDSVAGRSTDQDAASGASRLPKAFGVAARKGDLGAIKAAADWLRERGQPADPNRTEDNPSDEEMAYYVEVCACEMEVRQAQGKQLRVMLSKLQPTFNYSPADRARRPGVGAIQRVLEEHGLASPFAIRIQRECVKASGPVGAEQVVAQHDDGYATAPGRERGAYCLCCPTDHTDEDVTRSRLIAFLRVFFSNTIFLVSFENCPLSEGGLWGGLALGL